jgi:hypothetical protein
MTEEMRGEKPIEEKANEKRILCRIRMDYIRQ